MSDFRRGAAAIQEANDRSQSRGDFKPFLPNIYWKDDGDESFVLFLNPLDEIPRPSIQRVWTKEGRTESVVARTDDVIGQATDPLREKWGYDPKDTCIAIAVELEAEFQMVKGRKRPAEFVVKTRTFERRIRDAKGELTDEREEVTVPVVGVIAQSPANFFNHVASQDANKAPIETSAALIRRVGSGTDTDYEVELLDDLPVDLGNLLEYVEEVSYLDEEETSELLGFMGDAETDEEAALVIGSILLDKYLDEISAQEEYDRVFALVDSYARYPYKGFKKVDAPSEDDEEAKPARTPRRSQRRSRQTEEAPAETAGNEDIAEPAEPAEPEAESAAVKADPAPKEKPARRSRSRANRSKQAEEPTPAATRSLPVKERMAELRADAEVKARARAQAAA